MKRYPAYGRILLVALILIVTILTSCSRKPLVLLTPGSMPELLDDLDRSSLIAALDNKFDLIIARDVIEHVIDFHKVIDNVKRYSRENG